MLFFKLPSHKYKIHIRNKCACFIVESLLPGFASPLTKWILIYVCIKEKLGRSQKPSVLLFAFCPYLSCKSLFFISSYARTRFKFFNDFHLHYTSYYFVQQGKLSEKKIRFFFARIISGKVKLIKVHNK